MNENESRETVADIVAAMRAMTRVSETFVDRFSNRCLRTAMEMEAKMRRNLADRIEAAVDRERRQYERLHECFWDKGAVQCIIRRMRDSRDDLARAYPEAARELDYYADELIRARCERAASNAAAICEALEALVAYWDWNGYDAMRESRLKDNARAALAAPPRNCDEGTPEEQTQRMHAQLCSRRKSCYELPSGEQCPLYLTGVDCRLTWAQMPYKAEEGGE